MNDIDDISSAPLPKRKRSPSFEEVVASSPQPLTGPHRRRPAKPNPAQQIPQQSSEQQPKQSPSNHRRAARRSKQLAKTGHIPSTETVAKHVQPAIPLATGLTASTLPAAFGAYCGKVEDKKEKLGSKVRRSLSNLLGLGFQLIEWDGFSPRPIIDGVGRIIAVLAGQPDHTAYRAAAVAAFNAIRDAGNTARFPAAMRIHRRGLYAAVSVGLSYGKGQQIPSWLDTKEYTEMVEKLLINRAVGRLAGFADAAFALWAPRLYKYYREYDAALHTRHPHLRRPFASSVFFCSCFNFGPNVWTFRHRDVLNLAFGWCAVQALGNFDHKKGGHLILWDLKLVVEFPAGALILLPSATIAHSNIPVQEGEERASFTQFSAGGIFRYIDNNFQTVEKLEESDPAEYECLMALKASRWENGLKLLSTLDEFAT
ncbi:hypothetical protein C8J57DRAFT_1061498 [Mycena rebaudengoi]|nr:hypothetical protein C8J57DRAFT_1061498 [Mycena rebaudengoi]